jgi:hypothetical protein
MFNLKKTYNIILLLGLFLALYNLGGVPASIHYDEISSKMNTELFINNLLEMNQRAFFQVYFVKFSFWQQIFFPILRSGGYIYEMVFINRLVSALSMWLSIIVVYKILKELNFKYKNIIIGLIIYTTSSFYFLYSHFLNLITFYNLYGLLFVLFTLRFLYNEKNKSKNIILASIFFILTSYTHAISTFFLLTFPFFLFLLTLRQEKFNDFFEKRLSFKKNKFAILTAFLILGIGFYPNIQDILLTPDKSVSVRQNYTFTSYLQNEKYKDIASLESFIRIWNYFSPAYLVTATELTKEINLKPNIYIYHNLRNQDTNEWITERVSPFGFISIFLYIGVILSIVLYYLRISEISKDKQILKKEVVIISLLLSYFILSVIPNYGNPSLAKNAPLNILIIISIIYAFEFIETKINKIDFFQKKKYLFTLLTSVILMVNVFFNLSYLLSLEYQEREKHKFNYGYQQISQEIINNNYLSEKPTILLKDNLWSRDRYLEYFLGPYILESVVRLDYSNNLDFLDKNNNYLLITKNKEDKTFLDNLGLKFEWKEYKTMKEDYNLYFAKIGNFANKNIYEIYDGALPQFIKNYDYSQRIADFNTKPTGVSNQQQQLKNIYPDIMPGLYFSDYINEDLNYIQPVFTDSNVNEKETEETISSTIETRQKEGNLIYLQNEKEVYISAKIIKKCNIEIQLSSFVPQIKYVNNTTQKLEEKISVSLVLDSQECMKKNQLFFDIQGNIINLKEILEKELKIFLDLNKLSYKDFRFKSFFLESSELLSIENKNFKNKENIINCTPEDFNNNIYESSIDSNGLFLKSIQSVNCIKKNLNLANTENKENDLFLIDIETKNVTGSPLVFNLQKDSKNILEVTASNRSKEFENTKIIIPSEQEFLNYDFFINAVPNSENYIKEINLYKLNYHSDLNIDYNNSFFSRIKEIKKDLELENNFIKFEIDKNLQENLFNDFGRIINSECTPYPDQGGKYNIEILDNNSVKMLSDKKVACIKIPFYNLESGSYRFSFKVENLKGSTTPSLCILQNNECLANKTNNSVDKGWVVKSSYFNLKNNSNITFIINNYAGGNDFDEAVENIVSNISIQRSQNDFINKYFLVSKDFLNKNSINNIETEVKINKNFIFPRDELNFKTNNNKVTILKNITYDKYWELKIKGETIEPVVVNNSYLAWYIDLEYLDKKGAVEKNSEGFYEVKGQVSFNFIKRIFDTLNVIQINNSNYFYIFFLLILIVLYFLKIKPKLTIVKSKLPKTKLNKL